jgi:hypothetical protein
MVFEKPLQQINPTTTGFFGGYNDPRQIVTFNWETMEYRKHSEELTSGANVVKLFLSVIYGFSQ